MGLGTLRRMLIVGTHLPYILKEHILNGHCIPKDSIIFLSDPGIPGVRSMGPDVRLSHTMC